METLVFKGNEGQALTSSLLVAEKFGKEHKHVLFSIRELIKGCAENSANLSKKGMPKTDTPHLRITSTGVTSLPHTALGSFFVPTIRD